MGKKAAVESPTATPQTSSAAMQTLKRLAKSDATAAAAELGPQEARFLVDMYYIVQNDRIRAGNQFQAITRADEPAFFEGWLRESMESVEVSIQKILDAYSISHPVGKWMRGICGIGPVIASGFLAHIDITQAPTVGHIWRFAGLDPTVEWGKGEKRPWNASLKTLCWKLGESFVKVSNNDSDFYGKIYASRKAEEIVKNDAGAFAEQAKAKLERGKFSRDTKAKAAYESGKLPPGHVHARAKRYAVKLFLAHLHHVWYVHHYGKQPPLPYAIAQLGHAHMIEPPGAVE